MAVFLYSRKALAFYFEQTDINWIGEFSMSVLHHSIPFFSIISLCVAIPLTLTSARTMLLYESWSKRGLKLSASTNMRRELKDRMAVVEERGK